MTARPSRIVLAAAIATAGEHDWRCSSNRGLMAAKSNVPCSPKAGDEPEASWSGEIVLDHQNDDQFYDFDSEFTWMPPPATPWKCRPICRSACSRTCVTWPVARSRPWMVPV